MNFMAPAVSSDLGDSTASGRDTTTYPQLLSLAHEADLTKVATQLLQAPTEDNGRLAVVKAEVTTSRGVFEALGDASPESVEDFLVPHLIRVAETRAKARAFRDAVGIGVVSQEEISGSSFPPVSHSPGLGERGNGRSSAPPQRSRFQRQNGNGHPRDQRRGSDRNPDCRDTVAANTGPMSEAQRRYLFRLMAAQGVTGEAAHESLKSLFRVGNLAQVNKVDAIRAIDQLLREAGPGNGHGHTVH